MKYKTDWPEARERLAALWEGRCLDRPCIGVTAPLPEEVPAPPVPADPETRWTDPAYLVAAALARIRSTWWGGEILPSVLPLAGWLVSLGGRPLFDDRTIWFEQAPVDFARPSPFVYDPGDAWAARFRAVYRAFAEAAGKDDFAVGEPCFLPANDLLSMHMGTTEFLCALKDHPAWMKDAILGGARGMLRARRECAEMLAGRHDFPYANAGWMPFWAPEPYMSTQSDVSCMLSPEMYGEFIVPELELYGREFGPLWYHLDGGDAKQHLPRLLSLPYVRVIQYTPAPCEPPNGPAHVAFYRAVQEAGRIVHIHASKENVLPLLREVRPELILVNTWCADRAEGEELLAAAKALRR